MRNMTRDTTLLFALHQSDAERTLEDATPDGTGR
jgi:hypothetical protein